MVGSSVGRGEPDGQRSLGKARGNGVGSYSERDSWHEANLSARPHGGEPRCIRGPEGAGLMVEGGRGRGGSWFRGGPGGETRFFASPFSYLFFSHSPRWPYVVCLRTSLPTTLTEGEGVAVSGCEAGCGEGGVGGWIYACRGGGLVERGAGECFFASSFFTVVNHPQSWQLFRKAWGKPEVRFPTFF